ncbi:MAG: BrxA family protein [Acidobacteriota bacterium]
MIDETYAAFQGWDHSISRTANLRRFREHNPTGATSDSWLLQTTKALNRRFDPSGRDRPLVDLARSGCDREIWKPLLLWHMTRDEFLVRDFLVHWLYPRYREGAYRLRRDDLVPYLEDLRKRRDVQWSGNWSATTMPRVAQALLRIAVDFGLLSGRIVREFASYHLPDESMIYLLHAMAESEGNAERIVHSPDWRMFLMAPEEVEHELLRLHQFHSLHYQVAGSLAQLALPFATVTEYAREIAR